MVLGIILAIDVPMRAVLPMSMLFFFNANRSEFHFFFPGFDPVRIGGTGVRLFTTGVPQARHREHVCAGAAAA